MYPDSPTLSLYLFVSLSLVFFAHNAYTVCYYIFIIMTTTMIINAWAAVEEEIARRASRANT